LLYLQTLVMTVTDITVPAMTGTVITNIFGMSRWEPNARGRLEEAALELYSQRGFDETTVAEIAQRAGLTERTYFRYFADKREVLFGGEDTLDAIFTRAVAEAAESVSPIDAVAEGLAAVAEIFRGGQDHARRRQAVIAANPALQERELIKLSRLAAATADALRRRGVTEPAASLTAEAGIAVFKVAFERWIGAPDGRQLSTVIGESLDELKAVAGGGP
jgi:AcrR family transcriptional regulator